MGERSHADLALLLFLKAPSITLERCAGTS